MYQSIQIVSQQLVSEQGQCEDVCDQVRYSKVRWCYQFEQVTDKNERHLNPERVEENTTQEGEKIQDMNEKTLQELEEKILTAIQFCLTDEVLDEFSMEKTASYLWKRLQDHYL